MAKKNLKIKVDTINGLYKPEGTIKQLDSVFFNIEVTEEGEKKDLTGQTIKLFARKSDGKMVEQSSGISITNAEQGELTIDLLNAAVQAPGYVYFELEISDSNGIISTADFVYKVMPKVGSDEAIESTNEVSTLKKVEAYVARAKIELQNFKELQTNMLKTNKTINDQEELRVEAESLRVENEKERQKSLGSEDLNTNSKKIKDAINELEFSKAENIKVKAILELERINGKNYGVDGDFYENEYVSYGTYLVVNELKEIEFTGFSQGSSNFPCLIFLDQNEIVIDSYYGKAGGVRNKTLNVPKKAKKIVINGNYTRQTENQNLFYPSLAKIEYLELETELKKYVDEKISGENKVGQLKGKKISWNGDSIMFGQGCPGGFAKMIADKFEMDSINYAVSGGTIAYTTNPEVHSVAKTVLEMRQDSDYIICEGGYNDYIYKEPLGKVTIGVNSEINNRTITGGMEQMCRNLLERFPGKKIGFIFTHKIKNSDYTPIEDWNSNGETRTFKQVHDSLVEVLRKYSIPFLDLYNESCFNTEFESFLKYTDINDGIHPNKKGYELFYVDKIINFLESL
ncbi:BppU family phage baseplate upper protein [Clostridium sp.]|uniref:BppU family phage baseplate upper protein n=1 Tax=Clostridium sp. TaxID=1506 RepID=UPI0028FE2D13|nr:BppU family phage baseplate upper protein [Clostridium sp.]MDU2284113.1 GDSL-type esterase/lipase family protein [Clostridium sp.]